MTCQIVRTHLSAYLDEALSDETMTGIRDHINSCDSCAGIYGTLLAAERSSTVGDRTAKINHRSPYRRSGAVPEPDL